MALGGGTWLFQNKKLPGTYINFISKDRPMTDIADRSYAAMALDLDWGVAELYSVWKQKISKRTVRRFSATIMATIK